MTQIIMIKYDPICEYPLNQCHQRSICIFSRVIRGALKIVILFDQLINHIK